MRSNSRRGCGQYDTVLLAEVEGEDIISTAAPLQSRQAATAHLFLPTGQYKRNDKIPNLIRFFSSSFRAT